MSENSRLKIHTSVRSEETVETVPQSSTAGESGIAQVEIPDKHPEEVRENLRRRQQREKRQARRSREEGQQLTAGEKLLRNTAVACALLLTVMALKNVDQPWSRQAAEGIRQAMTMRVDWDETLGKLSFVRAIVPDTALVFLNMGESADLIAPVNGEISHGFSDQQPWLEYRCESGEAVCAAEQGTVTAVGQGASGDWIVLVEHDEGEETVYGYLANAYVKVGDSVESGQQIGITAEENDSRLYFELRKGGESIDPTARLK